MVENAVNVDHCRYCRYPLPAEARKCTKCGSSQDWHRFLGMSTSVLGLLVALVSILTFALPIWQKAVTKPVFQPSVALVDINEKTGLATIALSNAGNAPAALTLVAIMRGDRLVTFDLERVFDDDAVIAPGEVQVERVQIAVNPTDLEGIENLMRMFASRDACHFQAAFIDASGKRKTIDIAATSPMSEGKELKELRGDCGAEPFAILTTALERMSNDPAFHVPMCRISTKSRKERGVEPTPNCVKALANVDEG